MTYKILLVILVMCSILMVACTPQEPNEIQKPPGRVFTGAYQDQHLEDEQPSQDTAAEATETIQEQTVGIDVFDDNYYFIDSITVSQDDDYVYVMADGVPNHETGEFPNSGNPHSISEQNYEFKFTKNPSKTNSATGVRTPGVAINGVKMAPGTAERWGCGIPCNPQNVDSDLAVWNIEAFQETMNLGLDSSNAHVQPSGAYHYHGIPQGLVDGSGFVLVGWAADGFPMYVDTTNSLSSGYALKSGSRPTGNDGPGGIYDGTYTQDFEFVGGDLDECNGAMIQTNEFPSGTYAYLLTDEFPYISRCVFGTPDTSFDQIDGGTTTQDTNQVSGSNRSPPQEALDACDGQSQGSTCSVGSMSGTCRTTPDGSFACVPQ